MFHIRFMRSCFPSHFMAIESIFDGDTLIHNFFCARNSKSAVCSIECQLWTHFIDQKVVSLDETWNGFAQHGNEANIVMNAAKETLHWFDGKQIKKSLLKYSMHLSDLSLFRRMLRKLAHFVARNCIVIRCVYAMFCCLRVTVPINYQLKGFLKCFSNEPRTKSIRE